MNQLLCGIHLHMHHKAGSVRAGSLPAAWVGVSIFTKDIQVLDLSQNCLSGSIPTPIGGQFAQSFYNPGQAALMVLAPMKARYSLCGSIPANANVTTADNQPLVGLSACPGQLPASWGCSTALSFM